MLISCVVKTTNNDDLGPEAKVATLNGNAIRRINRRSAREEKVAELKAKDLTYQFEKEEKKELRKGRQIRVSANILAQMNYYKISAESRKTLENPKLVIIRDENKEDAFTIKDTGNSQIWASFDDDEKKEEIINFGILSEKEITNPGDGSAVVLKLFQSRKDSFDKVRLTTKQIDAFQIEGLTKCPVEIKGRGQLGMAKPIFFQQRIVELVSKAYYSQCPRAVIVIRDDTQTTVDSIVPMKVLFWDDVLRLVPEAFVKHMQLFLRETLTSLYGNEKFDILKILETLEIKEDGVHFGIRQTVKDTIQRLKPLQMKDDSWFPSNFRHKSQGNPANWVVIGKGIPSFSFDFESVYLRYKCRKPWLVMDGCRRLLFLVEDAIGVEEILKNFVALNRRRHKIDVIVLYSSTNEKEATDIESVINKNLRVKDNIRNVATVKFSNTKELGRILYDMKLTLLPEPVPHVLLLLGATNRVPQRLLIDHLDFITLKNAPTFDFTQLHIPDVIASIGTFKECLEAKSVAENEFPNVEFKAFVTDLHKDHPGFYSCTAATVDTVMKANGLPIYKSFGLVKNFYVAT